MSIRAWLRSSSQWGLVLMGGVWLGSCLGATPMAPESTAQAADRTEAAPAASAMPVVTMPDFSELAERANPSVVSIQVFRKLSGMQGQVPQIPEQLRPFFPWLFQNPDPQQRQQRQPQRDRLVPSGAGSGFVISDDGYIVTNNHVIDKAEKIEVEVGEDESYTAALIGRDEKIDIALLKIEPRNKLNPLAVGRSQDLRIGQWVVAIGNPFRLNHTVTAGIVSALGRNIGRGNYDNYIQTDASINPGNSGGPLLNLRGEVIGVNTAIITRTGESAGIGLAVPADMVKNVVDQLRSNGSVQRGWIGVQIQKVTPTMAKGLGLPNARGAVVGMVTPGGPAAKAGLESSDVITHVDGVEIGDYHDLPVRISQLAPGTKVELTVFREGKSLKKALVLGTLPDDPNAAAQADAPGEAEPAESQTVLGMVLRNIEATDIERFELTEKKGALVVETVQGSAADYAALRPGDVVRSAKVEGKSYEVATVEDLRTAVRKAQDVKAEVVVLVIVREGQKALVALDLKAGQ